MIVEAPFKQETPYFCGPACLRVLALRAGYTYHVSQSELAQMARTTPKGTSVYGLKKALKAMFSGFTVHKGPLTGEPPSKLVLFWERKRDHWLVAELLDEGWWVYDPEFGSILLQSDVDFRRNFFSRSWSYGLFVDL